MLVKLIRRNENKYRFFSLWMFGLWNNGHKQFHGVEFTRHNFRSLQWKCKSSDLLFKLISRSKNLKRWSMSSHRIQCRNFWQMQFRWKVTMWTTSSIYHWKMMVHFCRSIFIYIDVCVCVLSKQSRNGMPTRNQIDKIESGVPAVQREIIHIAWLITFKVEIECCFKSWIRNMILGWTLCHAGLFRTISTILYYPLCIFGTRM